MNTVVYDVFSVYEYSTERLSWKNTGGRKYHILSYQLTGRYDHTVNGRVLSVCGGSLFFINQGDSYSVRCVEQGSALCVCFSADTDLSTAVYDVGEDSLVLGIFKRMQQAGALELDANRYAVVARIYELLAVISRRQSPVYLSGSTRERLHAAHAYLIENYRKKDFDARVLTQICGVGQKQLVKLFRSEYGASPTQYVIQLRMNAAARLLEEGHLGVSEVAALVGYEDVYYFGRLFKRHFLVSPGRYRESAGV